MAKNDESKAMDRDRLLAVVGEQQAALSTYKETLSRIYQEFDARIGELSLIRRVSDVLRQAEDLQGLALGLVEVAITELPADFVSLMLADPEMTTLTPVAVYDSEWDGPQPVQKPRKRCLAPLGKGILGQAMSQGRILIIPDLKAKRPRPWPADLPKNAQSLMALPLVARQQILGAILLVSLSPKTFAEEHTRTLTIICDHAASALVNVRLIEELGEINERLLTSELQAHQAREYLQRILDTAGDMIFIADKQGKITYANQAAGDLGYEPGELIGRMLPTLFSDPMRAKGMLSLEERMSEELEALAKDGGARHILAGTTPLPESGEVLASLRDITQRRVLERQLMHAEKLASVGILAAGVAHEIGNPLSAISGYAQLMDTDDIKPEERREFASAIASQAERINKIIRDLLDYSRPSPFQGQAAAVNQAIEAVLNMFFTEKRLKSFNLIIDRDLSRDLPPVLIDRDQLQQVVLNMVMNAAQAMEKGGRLSISTREKDGWVRIAFKDTGPGIPRESLPLIFDPFFTTKPVGQGTGLGLSICDRIINQAGGRIEVKSRLGKGTTFTVLLPALHA